MMNKHFRTKMLFVVFITSVLQTAVKAEPSSPGKGPEVRRDENGSGKPRPGKKPPLADLSPEDREAVKKALQAVWENPEVMQARDEVKRATDTFRLAIKKAVKQQDPRVAALVEKLHKGGRPGEWEKKRSTSHEGRGGRPPMGGRQPGSNGRGQGAPGEVRGIAPAGFLAFRGDFSKEERERLEVARKKVMESDAFRKVQEDLKVLLKQGEGLRKKRVEMFHRTRVEMMKAMIEADPEVRGLLERLEKKKRD